MDTLFLVSSTLDTDEGDVIAWRSSGMSLVGVDELVPGLMKDRLLLGHKGWILKQDLWQELIKGIEVGSDKEFTEDRRVWLGEQVADGQVKQENVVSLLEMFFKIYWAEWSAMIKEENDMGLALG